jgi:XTP/dITP diphosphohydrolase
MTVHKRKLLLGTSNPGKRVEMHALLKNLGIQLYVPEELGEVPSVREMGKTYEENARIKAVSLAVHFRFWTIADDTGLEVDTLGGKPGLHSARLLGPGASDAQRRARLLELLEGNPRPWTACFRCVAALAGPMGQLAFGEGVCKGEIIAAERGSHGFGYDAIFKVAGTNKTMAELSLEEKNTLSHRARAVKMLLPSVREFLGIRD